MAELSLLALLRRDSFLKVLFYLDYMVYKMPITEEILAVLLPLSCAISTVLGSKQSV